MDSDKQLKFWYNKYNTKYFNGELPSDTLIQWDPPPDSHADTCPVYEVADNKFRIRMDPITKVLEWAWKALLLHEMVHIKLWPKHPKHQHGKLFWDEMGRIFNLGAFRHIL